MFVLKQNEKEMDDTLQKWYAIELKMFGVVAAIYNWQLA